MTYKHNTSEIITGISTPIKDKQLIVGQTDINNVKFEVNDDFNLTHKESLSSTLNDPDIFDKTRADVVIKHNDRLDKLNTQNHYTFAGYNEKKDFKNYSEKSILYKVSKEEYDFHIEQYKKGLLLTLHPYTAYDEDITLVDASNNIRNLSKTYRRSVKLGDELLIKYNKPIRTYTFDNRTNKYVYAEENYSIRDLVNDKSVYLDTPFKLLFRDCEDFHLLNKGVDSSVIRYALHNEQMEGSYILNNLLKIEDQLNKPKINPTKLDDVITKIGNI